MRHRNNLAAFVPAFALALSLGGCGTMDKVSDWWSSEEAVLQPSPLGETSGQARVEVAWSRKVGEGSGGEFVEFAPALAAGRLFAADRGGRVYAFDADSGNPLWQSDVDAALSGGPGAGEGLVVVGSDNGAVIALSAESGALLWQVNVGGEILSLPRVAQGTVIVQSSDGRLHALEARDGATRWTHAEPLPILTLRGSSSPAVVRGGVVAGFDNGKLVAIELAGGNPVWETTLALPSGRTELERMVDVDGDPQVVGDTLYAAAYQGRVGAVAVPTGEALWGREISSFAGIGVDRRQVYVTDEEDRVWGLSRRDGAPLWKQERLLHRRLTAPEAYEGYAVVGDLEGWVHWISAEDGSLATRVQAGTKGFSHAPVAGERALYTLNDDGTLSALRLLR